VVEVKKWLTPLLAETFLNKSIILFAAFARGSEYTYNKSDLFLLCIGSIFGIVHDHAGSPQQMLLVKKETVEEVIETITLQTVPKR